MIFFRNRSKGTQVEDLIQMRNLYYITNTMTVSRRPDSARECILSALVKILCVNPHSWQIKRIKPNSERCSVILGLRSGEASGTRSAEKDIRSAKSARNRLLQQRTVILPSAVLLQFYMNSYDSYFKLLLISHICWMEQRNTHTEVNLRSSIVTREHVYVTECFDHNWNAMDVELLVLSY